MKRFIFVMGPTGVGKSAWSLHHAVRLQASIINCDSIQVYTRLDIGSAKPSPEERKVRPHFLFDYVSYPDVITAGKYHDDFFNALNTISDDIVFVVGGTGFYFQALEKGMYPVKHIGEDISKKVREDIHDLGWSHLYQWIKNEDPVYGARIHEHDHYRIERAYELMLSEMKTMTEIMKSFEQSRTSFPFPYLKIGFNLQKEELANRIQNRTKKMLDMGLLEEVEHLLSLGFRNWDPLKGVGYKECLDFFDGKVSKNELGSLINQNTMKLIKKQKTWFKRDKETIWIDQDTENLSFLDRFISS